jgi:hypothetical protein
MMLTSTGRFICIALAYFLAFARLFFCAAEVLARTAAFMMRFFAFLAFNAAIAASTPASHFASAAGPSLEHSEQVGHQSGLRE